MGRSSSVAFSTADNGLSWQSAVVANVNAGGGQTPSGNSLVDMSVLDAQNAWVLTNPINGRQTLARTTSGIAGTFAALPTQLPAVFTLIHFFSGSTAVALTSSLIYRTTDGGMTWGLVTNHPPFNTSWNKQSQPNNLWLTNSTGTLLHTADAGLTWATAPNIGKVTFEDALHGLAYSTAAGGALLRTADGGTTWTPVAFTGQPQFRSIAAVPGQPGSYISCNFYQIPNQYTYVGTSTISRDRGASWQPLTSDATRIDELVAASPTQIWTSTAFDWTLNPTVPGLPMLMRYNGTALASKRTVDQGKLVAYPNPTTGLVHLDINSVAQVEVYNSIGRLCYREELTRAAPVLNLAGLLSGIYQVVIKEANGATKRAKVNKL
jgi:hypothetical protein